MSSITTRDGAEIFYKDWSSGPTVVFSHGWPLNADAWDAQMLFLGKKGYRVVAHDRRGHGRSEQTWSGHDMDTYADDLADLIEALDLNDIVLIGHSTGGGEVTRYIGRHGTSRVSRVVLLSAVPPLLLKTAANPGGLPIELFDQIRTGIRQNRSQFFGDFAVPFYGYNRKGAKPSQRVLDSFWAQATQAGVNAVHDCVAAFSETDFTDDLKSFNVPTLVAHAGDDQVVPLGISSMVSSKLIKGATLKIYDGAPHGMATTHADLLNADILAFIEAGRVARSEQAPSVH